MRTFVLAFLPLVALGALTPSCTASLELDRFRSDQSSLQGDGGAVNVDYYNLRFTATDMESHLNEYFEIRVIDGSNEVKAKAVYNDVFNAKFTMFMGKFIPTENPPYRIDFWADHNLSGAYSGIVGPINDKDHAWRRILQDPLPNDIQLVGSTYVFDFLHNTTFNDIALDLEGKPVLDSTGNPIPFEGTLLPFELTVAGANTYLGKTMEIRVIESSTGALVGLYRQGRLKEPFKATITGILDEVTDYEVTAFVDDNATGGYDVDDPAWKFEFKSNAAGASVELDVVALPQTPIETGERDAP